MCDEIRTVTQPLQSPYVDMHELNGRLRDFCRLAWDLSARILTSRINFDFRFPETGTRFSANSMSPVYPDLPAVELQTSHWRVALVVSPVITVRNDTTADIEVHSVSMADVICMQ